jgi:hypothetical protein
LVPSAFPQQHKVSESKGRLKCVSKVFGPFQW